MKRKLMSAILCVAMVATMLVGCGSKTETAATTDAAATEEAAPAEEAATEEAAPAEEATPATAGMKVGVAMPTQSSER